MTLMRTIAAAALVALCTVKADSSLRIVSNLQESRDALQPERRLGYYSQSSTSSGGSYGSSSKGGPASKDGPKGIPKGSKYSVFKGSNSKVSYNGSSKGSKSFSLPSTPTSQPAPSNAVFLMCQPCDGTTDSSSFLTQYDGKYYSCPGEPYYEVAVPGESGSGSPYVTHTNGGCNCQCYGDDDCYCTCSYDDDSYGNNQIKYDITYGPGISGNPCKCSCQDTGNGYSCSCDCQHGSPGYSAKGYDGVSPKGYGSKSSSYKGVYPGSGFKKGGSGSMKYNDDYVSGRKGSNGNGYYGKTGSGKTDDYYSAYTKGAGGNASGSKGSSSTGGTAKSSSGSSSYAGGYSSTSNTGSN